ncbi:Arm DNA-binding domain-containing protein [Paludibacterium yongneupense]|uniref:Arm DNA-binding domain-containing protein n=1 Tax=Paludibacterium yongneupense TaxID=400061 RepID=UPI00048F7A64|nr:Arm DNA-binding domain-containing protein [Paludibacterium yongneupense]
MALTKLQVDKAVPREDGKPLKLSDGMGLTLYVLSNGGKYWRFRYRWAGKEQTLALGVYPDVSLKLARERRDEARRLLLDGIDPNAQRKEDPRC